MNPNKPISSIMTKDLVTVSPDTYLSRVTRIFDNNDFHHVPVVKNGGKLAGIISKEDFQKMNYYFFEKLPNKDEMTKVSEGLRASDIMTPYPLSVDPDDSIGLAADIFLANRFHALPVVEDDVLVGLVTSHDLIKYAFTRAFRAEEKQETYTE